MDGDRAAKPSGCRLVKEESPFAGKQGLTYRPGICAEAAGARGIHLQLLTLPPGGRAKAHKHAAHETAIYVFSGESCMWHGEGLGEHMHSKAGDFVFIPANVPHLPYNSSATEPCIALIARTDPDEQESVVLLPELESKHD